MADAHDGPIDLLLTDAIMPGKSGLELANLMVARRPGLPVIVMSGYTEENLAISGLTEPVSLLCRNRSRLATSAAASAKCSIGDPA